MKKIKAIFLFLAIIGLQNLKAQQTIDVAGGDASGSGGTSSYSIGQVVYSSVNGAGGTSNEGVQQPYEFVTVGISENNNINLSYSVYPNPTSNSIVLNIENQTIENLQYQLYDINGKLLMNQKVVDKTTYIAMEAFANATYFLKVSNNNSEVKSFKIIKNK